MNREITLGNVNFGASLCIPLPYPYSEKDAINRMTEYLRDLGYNVTPPNHTWETTSTFMKRVGIKRSESLHRDIAEWQRRGGALALDKTGTGRLRALCSNPDFDKFVVRNKAKKPEC